MPLGPFDSRAKRSRCSACSTSHLKCSGDVPCRHCARRRIACTYTSQNTTNKLILVERGKQKTQTNWSLKLSQPSTSTLSSPSTDTVTASHINHYVPPAGRLNDKSTIYITFFDTFTRRNNFTGRSRTTGDEVKQLAELHSRKGNHLLNAMLAIGAMYAGRLNAEDGPPKRESLLIAFQHYSYAVDGLKEAIDAWKLGPAQQPQRRKQDQHVCILWTTFFLGLFELMNDVTGHWWLQHIVHGTSMALKASGPESCRSGPGLAFFIQARIFEVSRTILFNEPTFLTEPEWVALSRDMWTTEGKEVNPESGAVKDSWRPLDSLLDIMVMCSNLRVRAATFIAAQDTSPSHTPVPDARAISEDGHRLREALTSWRTAYMPETEQLSSVRPEDSLGLDDGIQESGGHQGLSDPSSLMARVFYAAISIYLSGVFDYELLHWQQLGIAVAALDEATIVQHLHTILALTELGLDRTALSPLVFLFPLRIAGARSRYQWQRDQVVALVERVGEAFAVASAIKLDLLHVWKTRRAAEEEDFANNGTLAARGT